MGSCHAGLLQTTDRPGWPQEEPERGLLFLLLVLLSNKLGKPLAGERKSVMNDNEDDWATLSWQEA